MAHREIVVRVNTGYQSGDGDQDSFRAQAHLAGSLTNQAIQSQTEYTGIDRIIATTPCSQWSLFVALRRKHGFSKLAGIRHASFLRKNHKKKPADISLPSSRLFVPARTGKRIIPPVCEFDPSIWTYFANITRNPAATFSPRRGPDFSRC